MLVRIIATLGVFAILEQAVPLIFGTNFQEQEVSSFYPSGAIHLGGSLLLPYSQSIVVGVTVVLGLVLRVVMDRTAFGLATTATAENPLVASTNGGGRWADGALQLGHRVGVGGPGGRAVGAHPGLAQLDAAFRARAIRRPWGRSLRGP